VSSGIRARSREDWRRPVFQERLGVTRLFLVSRLNFNLSPVPTTWESPP
jgi:hypothetical protein